jgi:hypothetical protein
MTYLKKGTSASLQMKDINIENLMLLSAEQEQRSDLWHGGPVSQRQLETALKELDVSR